MVEATGMNGSVLVDVDLSSVPIPSESCDLLPLPDMDGIRDGKRVRLEALVWRHRFGTYLLLKDGMFRWYGVRLPLDK